MKDSLVTRVVMRAAVTIFAVVLLIRGVRDEGFHLSIQLSASQHLQSHVNNEHFQQDNLMPWSFGTG